MKRELRFKLFPISFFAVILGLVGFTIATQKIEKTLSFLFQPSMYLLAITVIIFIVILITYTLKTVFHWQEVVSEYRHPMRLSFFPTISISILLFSIAFADINMEVSRYLWIVGTIIHAILFIIITSRWIQIQSFEIKHFNPSWFIPPVGNLLIPVSGVLHYSQEISWLFFSIGLIFWIAKFSIFLNRIIFHNPMPEKLLPTFFILIAPPAIGFIAYIKLVGEIDSFARILYYFAFFLVFLLFAQIKMFVKIKFYLSWWAYSFPLASIVLASILMYHKTEAVLFKYFAVSIWGLLSILVVVLTVKTIQAMMRKEVCIEE